MWDGKVLGVRGGEVFILFFFKMWIYLIVDWKNLSVFMEVILEGREEMLNSWEGGRGWDTKIWGRDWFWIKGGEIYRRNEGGLVLLDVGVYVW